MAFDVTDFKTLLTLESHGPDVFIGIGPSYPWGRVYGGQVVAQALCAAYATVDEKHFVHSLHAYFIRGGDSEEPIRYEVDRIRNGRSFITRRVVARQSVGPILNLSASFQICEDEADVQECAIPTKVPTPEGLPSTDWGPILERRSVEAEGARATTWLRVAGPIGDDRVLQDCALAYTSDDIPTEAASRSHPRHPRAAGHPDAYDELFIGASLDHSIWFHRPGRNDDWVLHDFQGHGVVGGRGLTVGQLFARDGVHLATVAQEILMRERVG
ncbi:MAG: acyl-CoA thioesterase II [Deltaproteobacteria bacterium]|nr:acyl-CoA thioesterase II [Deltaproteobacteria bacterium]